MNLYTGLSWHQTTASCVCVLQAFTGLVSRPQVRLSEDRRGRGGTRRARLSTLQVHPAEIAAADNCLVYVVYVFLVS